MIGENDNAHGRRTLCEKFDAEVRRLKEENPGEYPIVMEFKQGFGHSGLPDRDKLQEMLPRKRNAIPHNLSWELTDSVVSDFFWLAVPTPKKNQRLDATLDGNAVRIKTQNVNQFLLELDSRLISLDKPLTITLNGTMQTRTVKPSFATLCRSLQRRGDPALASTCEIALDGEPK
jgi:hypothetical protein